MNLNMEQWARIDHLNKEQRRKYRQCPKVLSPQICPGTQVGAQDTCETTIRLGAASTETIQNHKTIAVGTVTEYLCANLLKCEIKKHVHIDNVLRQLLI